MELFAQRIRQKARIPDVVIARSPGLWNEGMFKKKYGLILEMSVGLATAALLEIGFLLMVISIWAHVPRSDSSSDIIIIKVDIMGYWMLQGWEGGEELDAWAVPVDLL